MTGPSPARAALYLPAEVAVMLRCSEWWVKEQARKRRIPYSRIGGGYRFTDEHIAEIIRLFEVEATNAPASPPTVRQSSRPPAGDVDTSVIRLSARVPRRARSSTSDVAA